MLASGNQILEFIPQRPPFVMVDTLFSSNERETVSCLTITSENKMVFDGFFQEGGILENIAQTAACGVGYQSKLLKQEVPVGFIGSIKKINIFELPKVGTKITTRVNVLTNIMDASVIGAEVRIDERVVATCEMNIFLKK